jgi:predicted acetyltransferase
MRKTTGEQCMLRRTPSERGIKLEWLQADQVVSTLSVIDLQMRIGDIAVRCAGIGGVRTEREYRNKGHARQLLEGSLAFMREEGYHLSALFGIPNFYTKFGFAPALTDSECRMATRDAEAASPRFAVREALAEDLPHIAQMHATRHAQRSGSIVRHPQKWGGFRLGAGWTDRVSAFVALDGERVIGYASYNLDPWRFGLGEIGYADATVFSTLLAEAARRAVALRVEQIPFHLPADDSFALYCRRFGCEIKITYPRWGGGMLRIIDQAGLLHLLQPLVLRRLQAGGAPDWRGALTVATELGANTLPLGGGDTQLRIETSQDKLIQLLMGYRSIADLASNADVAFHPQDAAVLETLFPPGYPYMSISDRF